MASCAHCGEKLPKGSRFCPHCGRPADAGATKVLELPPDETGPVPVDYTQVEARYYGVTPTRLALALAAVSVLLAAFLFATGHWPIGLIVLGLAVLLLVVSVETGAFRAHAGVAADSVATRGRAARRLLALRRELRRVAVNRARLLFELGDAVYRDDEETAESVRKRVAELDRAAREREGEMQEVIAQAQDRLHRRRLEVQPTEMVELPEEPSAPGEQDPVGPAVIPEPYPPPDEGNPPQPAIIPEPSPAVIPEPGPQGPEEKGS
jgi:hypothetical protein